MQNLWQSLTRTIPLNSAHDLVTRLGVRLSFCTLPFFLLVLIWRAFDPSKPLLSPEAMLVIAVPIVGGLIDGYRLWRVRVAR